MNRRGFFGAMFGGACVAVVPAVPKAQQLTTLTVSLDASQVFSAEAVRALADRVLISVKEGEPIYGSGGSGAAQ